MLLEGSTVLAFELKLADFEMKTIFYAKKFLAFFTHAITWASLVYSTNIDETNLTGTQLMLMLLAIEHTLQQNSG